MRHSAFIGAAIAALGIGSFASIGSAAAIPAMPMISIKPTRASRGGKAPFRYRTGVTYPHSSERQRARYARQIAAGQIKNTA